jgi:hypothetical protein
MKVYGIASEQRRTYGLGDCGVEQVIETTEGYGTGPYPPVFVSREQAERYLTTMRFPKSKHVVELELIEEPL